MTVRVEGIAPDTVVVFHNGIDVAAFSNMTVNWTVKQKLGIPKDNKVIGIIANFRPMKRHDTFLRAAQGILAIRNDVDFLLVGHRNAADKSQVLAQELGIAERLHFVGSQPNVVPYLSVMDIGVNCSEREGLSNAVMEYMAARVPCVVSQSGGNPDLITQGETGLTFPLGDHQALTTAVLTLLENESLRRKFAQNAKEKVDRQLTVSFMLSRYHDFYCAMMQ